MNILFVSNGSFDDYTLLSRAFTVALEGEVAKGNSHITVQAIGGGRVADLLTQLVDSTKDFLNQKGVWVKIAPLYEMLTPTTVVAFKPISYYPHKALVNTAKANNATVLEY